MYKRILVCIDGSAASAQALATALKIAGLRGSRLRLLHVLEHPASLAAGPVDGHGQHFLALAREEARTALRQALETADDAEAEADTRLVDADGRRIGEVVASEAQAWAADLVVVGSHGRKGVRRALLGSGAEQIVRMATVPVLVVRATS